MNIAVVILNWNGEALLQRFLPAVVAHSKGAALYVIDNASTDGSVAFLQQNYPDISIVQNAENGGFVGGYNTGLIAIEADVFCLLNSDVEVTPGWLEPIRQAFQTLPDAAIIQPKILDLKRPEYFEYSGAAGGFIDMLGYPFCRGRIFQMLEQDRGQYNDVKEIFWATGACMCIKSEVFKALNGFDPDYFSHQEEIDLCWRAKNAGYTVYYVGKSHVYHLGGGTLSTMSPRKTFFNFRNSLYSLTKNLPRKWVFPIVAVRLLLDIIAAFRFAFQGKGKHAIAILKAHYSFYAHFRTMYAKRKKMRFTTKYSTTTSVVWSHFVCHVRHFNRLIKD